MGELKDIRQFPKKAVDSPSNGLTGIPKSIHWPATQTDVEARYDELDRIDIENFLDTLAQVAITIAARERATTQTQGQDG